MHGLFAVPSLFALLVGKQPFCVFEPPLFGCLGATYDAYLRLTGKSVVYFLLLLIELFLLDAMNEALRANID